MDRLTEKDFSFKCPMSWDAMQETANGRYCSKCRKEVFDLTNCSLDEVRALQEKHGSICGTVRLAQAAAVALSLSAAACHDTGRTTGTPLPAPPKAAGSEPSKTTADTGNQTPRAAVTPKANPPELDPFEQLEPLRPPMIMGIICPQQLPNDEDEPTRVKIDI